MPAFKAPPELTAAQDIIDITDAAIQQKIVNSAVDVPTLLRLAENWKQQAACDTSPDYTDALHNAREALLYAIITHAKDPNATHQPS